MLARLPLFAALVAVASLAPASRAQEGAPTPTAEAPLTQSAAAPPERAPRLERSQLSPMVAEMFDAMDEQRVQVRALRAELARTRDAARAFQLQKDIAAAKQTMELRLLRIQAVHARRAGRDEVARGLEAAIEAMIAPAASAEPIARPAPPRDDAR